MAFRECIFDVCAATQSDESSGYLVVRELALARSQKEPNLPVLWLGRTGSRYDEVFSIHVWGGSFYQESLYIYIYCTLISSLKFSIFTTK